MLGLASPFDFALAQPAGHYEGDLELKPLDGRMMQLKNRFSFIEANGNRWTVPDGAILDGASIPRVFWSIVGGPWDGNYRAASVIHDWYCAVRIQPWKSTHRMFFHGMLASGVSAGMARMMFLAVFYAGPSWDDLTIANSRLLTDQGKTRPPGSQPKSRENFMFDGKYYYAAAARDKSEPDPLAQAYNAAEGLKSELKNLALRADRGQMSEEEMIALVDKHGRQEDLARDLELAAGL
jgi:hypothetical protein